MNVLLLNGSPKGSKSNTLVLANAFCSGFPEGAEVKTIHLSEHKILPCRGCFCCWNKTPGKCVIKDDMTFLHEEIKKADVIIESFPLYFFGMPALMKNMTDRCLPLTRPYLGGIDKKDAFFHEIRDPALSQKKLCVFSTCGFSMRGEMFDALQRQFELICSKGTFLPIFCPQGELFSALTDQRRLKGFLSDLKAAGREYYETGAVSDTALKRLKEPVLSPKAYEIITKNRFLNSNPEKSEQIDRK